MWEQPHIVFNIVSEPGEIPHCFELAFEVEIQTYLT
jgi:hypothetical protein